MIRMRASALCFHQDQWLVVRLRDPHNRVVYLLPPGGEIQGGESPRQAAEREALEETGYQVTVDVKSELVVDYRFFWGGKHVPCKTHFFLGRLKSLDAGEITAEEPFLEGHEWLPTENLLAQLEFHPELKTALRPWIRQAYKSFASKN